MALLRSNRLNQTGLPTRKNKIIDRFTYQNEIVIFQPFPAVDLPCHPEPQSSADCMGKGHTSERVRIWPPRIRSSQCPVTSLHRQWHSQPNRQTDWWKGSVWPSHASREKASNHQCFSVSDHTARQYIYIMYTYFMHIRGTVWPWIKTLLSLSHINIWTPGMQIINHQKHRIMESSVSSYQYPHINIKQHDHEWYGKYTITKQWWMSRNIEYRNTSITTASAAGPWGHPE